MGKDSSERKSKKERRKSDVTSLSVDGPLVEKQVDQDGDVTMEANEVEIVVKDKKKKEKAPKIAVPVAELLPIAHPLAQDKLAKKVLKVVKKASKQSQVRRGVQEVMKRVRKGEKGILVIAANISPLDILSPLPVLAEDNGIPYIFVTSKEELGHSCLTKRSTSCVLVVPSLKPKRRKTADDKEEEEEDYSALYKEVESEVKRMNDSIST
ncbi:snoRNA-binding protein [Tulasnella sp. 403]|nr:snoRNA-binding protein [Tulasnella sp. 403]